MFYFLLRSSSRPWSSTSYKEQEGARESYLLLVATRKRQSFFLMFAVEYALERNCQPFLSVQSIIPRVYVDLSMVTQTQKMTSYNLSRHNGYLLSTLCRTRMQVIMNCWANRICFLLRISFAVHGVCLYSGRRFLTSHDQMRFSMRIPVRESSVRQIGSQAVVG